MKSKFIIANWKSHKTIEETKEWFEDISINIHDAGSLEEKKIIVCPPFPLLPFSHDYIEQHFLPISIGSQNISPFTEGAYTGEVSGKLIRDFATHAIIGHSERRKYFGETPELLATKVKLARSFGIMPIYCISDKTEKIPEGVDIVAYEPLAAIGSGQPDSSDDAENVADEIKKNNTVQYVLYGGSVTSDMVMDFTSLQSIDGVLIGGASLSADEFIKIIHNA